MANWRKLPNQPRVSTAGPNRDLLEVAENYFEFFIEDSCGQCTPCREGNVKLLEGVRLLQQGKCSNRYLNDLVALG